MINPKNNAKLDAISGVVIWPTIIFANIALIPYEIAADKEEVYPSNSFFEFVFNLFILILLLK